MLLHPGHMEAVAYAAARPDLIATVGLLVAVLGTTVAHGWPLVLGGFWLGWQGKEIAAVGLVLVPLLWWARTGRRAWLVWVGLLALVVGCWWQREIGAMPYARVHAPDDWALTQAVAATRLIWLVVWPFGYTVDPNVEVTWRSGLLALGTLGGLARLAQKRRGLTALGLAWIGLVILPRLIVQTPGSVMNAHQWYPAWPGVALIVAAWGQPLASWRCETRTKSACSPP